MGENTKNKKNSLSSLSKLIACDFFENRPCERLEPAELDKYAGRLVSIANSVSVVYTAFDGDHQMFCSQMRRYVSSTGAMPANPDSILGYKDTLSFRQSKKEVLLDDLSVLRGCDQLWIFSDLPASLDSIAHLAEGVLIELLYFKRRHPDRVVAFVSITDSILRPERAELDQLNESYEQIVTCLGEDQKDEVLELANSGVKVDNQFRSLKYYLFDPLDYKYSRFLREGGYDDDICPIIPYLAVRPEDFCETSTCLAEALVFWTKLMWLSSSCVRMPALDAARGPSQIMELLERVWLRKQGASKIRNERWSRYKVPKATQKERWAITKRERSQYEL